MAVPSRTSPHEFIQPDKMWLVEPRYFIRVSSLRWQCYNVWLKKLDSYSHLISSDSYLVFRNKIWLISDDEVSEGPSLMHKKFWPIIISKNTRHIAQDLFEQNCPIFFWPDSIYPLLMLMILYSLLHILMGGIWGDLILHHIYNTANFGPLVPIQRLIIGQKGDTFSSFWSVMN